MIISLRALRQGEILCVDTAAEFPPDSVLHCQCAIEGRDLDAILAEKIPKVKDDEREK